MMKKFLIPVFSCFIYLSLLGCDGGGGSGSDDGPYIPPCVVYVDDSATGANNGSSWTDAYNVLQQGVNAAASSACHVWAAEGTYTSGTTDPVLAMAVGVKIYGGFAGTEESLSERTDPSGHPTILDGQNTSYHVVIGAGSTLLDGFTVMNGNANTTWPNNHGGGMYNYKLNNLTVNNCVFQTNNVSSWGAGMFNYDSLVTITNCTFNSNSAGDEGGGMKNHLGSQTITNCTFIGNSTSFGGGGIYNYSNTLVLTNCTFSLNDSAFNGGGMYNDDCSGAISNCTFTANSALASEGGGIFNADIKSTTITNCIFISNYAARGGGMENSALSSPTIINCTFFGNYAAIDGGGMANFNGSCPSITNCIMWGDYAVSSGHEIYNYDSTPIVTYSDIQGGYTGTGNINADPLFLMGTLGDYYLSQTSAGQGATSPCVDVGYFGSSSPGGTTATNDAPDTGIVDMGYHYPVP